MISKAKAAKLVKALVDIFLDMEAGTGSEVIYMSLCNYALKCVKMKSLVLIFVSFPALFVGGAM